MNAVVVGAASLLLSACDPEPPSYIALSTSGDGHIVLHVNDCHGDRIESIFVTNENILTLGEREVVPNAVWGVVGLSDTSTITLGLGDVPAGAEVVGAWPPPLSLDRYRVVVYYGDERDDADSLALSHVPAGADPDLAHIGGGNAVSLDAFHDCSRYG